MIKATYPKLKNAVALSDYFLELEFDNDGEIEWSTGQDFCPHTLYEKSVIKQ